MTIEILDFTPELAPHFERLNRAWIEAFFEIEPQDLVELEHPGRIIAAGGAILFARSEGEIVGVGALQRFDDETFEVVKMGVDTRCQGRGIGRRILDALVERAADRGARRVRIETNRALAAANALYERAGFRPAADARSWHGYARADAFWERDLG